MKLESLQSMAKGYGMVGMTKAELSDLLAEIEAWKSASENQKAQKNYALEIANERRIERDALKAENESLRKDAERYRWLRNPDRCIEDYLDGPADNIVVGSCGGEDILWLEGLDSAIDAAISSPENH